MNRYLLIFVALGLIVGCTTPSQGEARGGAGEDGSTAASKSALPESEDSSLEDESEVDEAAEYDKPPPYDLEYDISEVYEQMCAGCHGETGDGHGPEGEGRAFGAPADEWNNGPTVDGILATLEEGIHDTAMRDFPEFKDVDRVELAEYVLDLRHALKGRSE